MKCQKCGEQDASIQYTELSEGKSEKLEICGECAKELGFDGADPPVSPLVPPLKGKLLGVVSVTETLASSDELDRGTEDSRVCSVCGLTGRDLAKQPLFGCARCYEVFESSLDDLFRRVHGAIEHRGRIPGGMAAPPADVNGLKRDLAAAISCEDFEEAARLRDELHRADPSWESGRAGEEPGRGEP